MDDEYYLNLSPDFVERLGYMAGIQAETYTMDHIPPFDGEVVGEERYRAWIKGFKHGYVKRHKEVNNV